MSPTGQDAHHRFCEFNMEASKQSNETLIDFANERSAETRFVRSLVCKGVENGAFDQGSIRAMRQWFFDLKSATRMRVNTTSDDINWMENLCRHPLYRRWPFRPVHAEMPGFNWQEAAKYQFTEDYSDLLHWLFERRKSSFFPNDFNRAKSLSEKYFEQEVFDASVLQPYYEKSVDLAFFVAKNSDFPNRGHPENYRSKGPPVSLLAFSALLLFVSDWDMDDAVELFAKLIVAPSASDETLGNVMGLNPFHDYSAWETLAIAAELAARSPSSPDYTSILSAIESRLQAEHRNWRDATNQ